MNDKKIIDERISIIGWAFLLIWWGLRWSVLASLPEGSGLLGTSLILFSLNITRFALSIPIHKDTTFFGVLSLLAGGALFICAVLEAPIQPPVFETILISLGVVLLAYGVIATPKTSMKGS